MSDELSNALFDSPDRPGLKELQWLNAGKSDGYVNVLVDDDKHDKLIPIISIPQAVINDPATCIPEFVNWFESQLKNDSYTSINAFWWRDNSYSHEAEKYRLIDPRNNKPLHKPIKGQGKQGLLRWLNAVYIDLDIYTAGITQGEAFKHVIDMMESKRIPPVSWIKNSGQGLWLFWALHPTRCWKKTELDSLPQYKRILQQLNLIFNDLGADRKAVDATRVSRIYGSRNHKSQTLVSLWQRTDANGNMARYTLDELEVFFGTYPRRHRFDDYHSCAPVENTPEQQELDEQQEPTEHRKRIGYIGQSARYELDLVRFWTLAEVVRQKKIKKGSRNAHVGILAAILRHVVINRQYNPKQRAEAIEAAAVRIWECFEDRPSYDLSSVKEQLISSIETQQEHNPEVIRLNIQHITIAQHLALTTAEAAQLADLVPGSRKAQFWPPAPGQPPFRLKPKPRSEQQQARRDYLARWYEGKSPPDSRTLAAEITKATGFDCSHTTAIKDWNAVFPSKPEHRQLYLLDDAE